MNGFKEKIRDATRSRERILAAAEALFADRGFDGVSLGEIGRAAGLSRGTPSYFFGSKAELYRAVLERVFEDREAATEEACRPLIAWATSETDAAIRGPLAEALGGYLDFLLERPAFLKLIQREELSGADRLRGGRRESKAIEEAFTAVRSVAKERGLRDFDVQDAVFLFVSLAFFPIAHRTTFMASLGRDLSDPHTRQRHRELAVEQLLRLTGGLRG